MIEKLSQKNVYNNRDIKVTLLQKKSLWGYVTLQRNSCVPMLFILDGNSEIGAQVRSNLCYLIYIRYLIRL